MQNDLLKRLYIEPSSRCNLRCAMCFRNSWIDETTGDMSENTFRQVLAHLPESVETVFFGGMGEPLVHARITDMVRAVSAAGRRTELLSNGALLDEERAAALLDAGLDMLWLSVDALDDASYGSIRCNGNLARLKEHITVFNRLRFRLERPVRLGLAFVVMKSNVRDLARLPGFAQYYHINEVNISHVIPTDEQSAGEILYRQVVGSDLGGDALLPTSPRIHMPLMDWMQPDVAYGAGGLLSSGMCEIFLSGQRLRRPARHCRFIDEGMAFVRHAEPLHVSAAERPAVLGRATARHKASFFRQRRGTAADGAVGQSGVPGFPAACTGVRVFPLLPLQSVR